MKTYTEALKENPNITLLEYLTSIPEEEWDRLREEYSVEEKEKYSFGIQNCNCGEMGCSICHLKFERLEDLEESYNCCIKFLNDAGLLTPQLESSLEEHYQRMKNVL